MKLWATEARRGFFILEIPARFFGMGAGLQFPEYEILKYVEFFVEAYIYVNEFFTREVLYTNAPISFAVTL